MGIGVLNTIWNETMHSFHIDPAAKHTLFRTRQRVVMATWRHISVLYYKRTSLLILVPVAPPGGYNIITIDEIISYGCESWAMTKADQWKVDAFETWAYRRVLLRVSWTTMKSNKWVLDKIGNSLVLRSQMMERKLVFFLVMWWDTKVLRRG